MKSHFCPVFNQNVYSLDLSPVLFLVIGWGHEDPFCLNIVRPGGVCSSWLLDFPKFMPVLNISQRKLGIDLQSYFSFTQQ